ncbi:ribonuclease HII [Flavobacterium arsenatis]|uniref:Ribonuclease HII n=1 Tax=Flavobacterium arsenatis TaxID=1484332 RepID=A0ABU1TK51_9FLAO|nr:hypothetical protein [Flavobacterium arsenatis]MDR6966359.1 ribonuclease HII [Flavobacterium arsenatis]
MKIIKVKISIIIISLSLFSCNEKKTSENIKIETVKSDDKFGLSENQRKELFKEIVIAEDKANSFRRSKEDSVLNLKLDKIQMKKEYDEIEILSKELLKKYKSEVTKKYKINDEQEKKIANEGLEKNWPLE